MNEQLAAMVENRVTSREALMAIDGIGKVRADKYGSTALMFAVWNKKPDVVRALLSAGADVHAKNRNGWTALALAEERGYTLMVKLLRAAGAEE